MPEFLLFLTLALALLVLWFVFGPGPRRRRVLRRVQQLLGQGQWKPALDLIEPLRAGRLSAHWRGVVTDMAAACQQAAVQSAIERKDFEGALPHAVQAAELAGRQEVHARLEVVEAILSEARALFAASRGADVGAVHAMLQRAQQLQPGCREAFFWQGLCQLREGHSQAAVVSLQAASNGQASARSSAAGAETASSFIDPLLYLGAIHLRLGQAREALRFLSEANRIDSGCPFVAYQLGMAMLQSGGDAALAVRALQKALGPRGFLQWSGKPGRAWVEGMPEQRSYVRKLASKHPFTCPVWGADYLLLLRQGNIALGDGHYRLAQFRESSQVYDRLMQEGAPSLPVLRGFGLALARLGDYDQAFKHLRAAHEREQPHDRLTAGYLALCGAMGKPLRSEDKIQNVNWAIRLVNEFTAPGDVEWAGLVSAIFAEARALQLPLERDDQLYVCEHLASVNATDPVAAAAFHFLMGTHPEVVRDEYAWLYVRSAQVHNLTGPYALSLFARAFAERDKMREFYAQHGWDLDVVELTFLERAAEQAPGAFPAALGPDYPPHGEALLLERSRQQEQAGRLDAALATADILLKLAPGNAAVHDLMARLHYRLGEQTQAMERLRSWQRLQPDSGVPLLRMAVICQEQGDAAGSLGHVRAALERLEGGARAEAAFLGARLAARSGDDRAAIALLQESLQRHPEHAQSRWLIAALRARQGDQAGLAEQAASMNQTDEGDPRYHYLAAVCRLAAGDTTGALEAAQRLDAPAAQGPVADKMPWEEERAFLMGLANLRMGKSEAAYQLLQAPANRPECPSSAQARAMLGAIAFARADHAAAAHWWRALDAGKRQEWSLSSALAGAVFLAGIDALNQGECEAAAEQFREAGRLGWRDRRLGQLLILALARAGQQHLFART